MMKEIPVLLLTGYLGSGKTTLVNKILANRKGIKFAVIVNDIGEVNIDADLIEKGGVVGKKDDSLVALQNGCICCTLKMDLVQQLHDITAMHKFDYIVIEASGICEPEPIAQTISSMPQMDFRYIADGVPRLDCVLTVVDALRMKSEFQCGEALFGRVLAEDDIENLVIQQVEFCNMIVLNKVSEVSKEDLGRIRAIIRTIQPKAKIVECDYADIDIDSIINTGLFDYDSVAMSATWIDELEHGHPDDDDDDDHDHHEGHDDDHDDGHEGHHHHHHHHDEDEGEAEEYGIGTYVYFRREPLDINRFDNFIAKHWPHNIIRAKGICYFSSEPDNCYLFEQAGSQVSLRNIGQWFATMPPRDLARLMEKDANLRRDWDDVYGDRMQKIVFIGQHLDKEEIARMMDFNLQES